ncbi:MAG: hypothetical protein M3321_00500 [Actinomycetota bacterium]|nr:hypothetical protein [Actinomycetota bacterium]
MLNKILGIAAATVSIAAVGLLVLVGPNEWAGAYVPNVTVAIAELTVGAALVGAYLRLRRRLRKARLQRMVDGQLFQAVSRLLATIQASYIEAAEHRAPSVPMTVDEVLDEWVDEVRVLDIRRPTTYEPATRWATYLPREVLGALDDLAALVARFPDLTEQVIEPLVELELDDEFVALLRYLPDNGPVTAPGVPATLTPYFHWTSTAAPIVLKAFAVRVRKLAELAEKAAEDRPLFDEYSWIDAIPPLWSSGRHRPEEDAREEAEAAGLARKSGIVHRALGAASALLMRVSASHAPTTDR